MQAVQNKLVIVWGAGGWVGQEVCRHVAKNMKEFKLMGVDVDQASLKAIGDELKMQTAVCDATDANAVQQLCQSCCKPDTCVWGMVNCIGEEHAVHSLSKIRGKDFDEILRRNVFTSFNILKPCVTMMGKQGFGRIVCLAGAAAYHGFENHEAWGAAKAAVIGMHRSAAAEYAHKGVRINCVSPSLVHHEESGTQAEIEKKTLPMYPLGRVAQPADVAAAVCFLLMPDCSDFLTGTALPVDGGLTSLLPMRMLTA